MSSADGLLGSLDGSREESFGTAEAVPLREQLLHGVAATTGLARAGSVTAAAVAAAAAASAAAGAVAEAKAATLHKGPTAKQQQDTMRRLSQRTGMSAVRYTPSPPGQDLPRRSFSRESRRSESPQPAWGGGGRSRRSVSADRRAVPGGANMGRLQKRTSSVDLASAHSSPSGSASGTPTQGFGGQRRQGSLDASCRRSPLASRARAQTRQQPLGTSAPTPSSSSSMAKDRRSPSPPLPRRKEEATALVIETWPGFVKLPEADSGRLRSAAATAVASSCASLASVDGTSEDNGEYSGGGQLGAHLTGFSPEPGIERRLYVDFVARLAEAVEAERMRSAAGGAGAEFDWEHLVGSLRRLLVAALCSERGGFLDGGGKQCGADAAAPAAGPTSPTLATLAQLFASLDSRIDALEAEKFAAAGRWQAMQGLGSDVQALKGRSGRLEHEVAELRTQVARRLQVTSQDVGLLRQDAAAVRSQVAALRLELSDSALWGQLHPEGVASSCTNGFVCGQADHMVAANGYGAGLLNAGQRQPCEEDLPPTRQQPEAFSRLSAVEEEPSSSAASSSEAADDGGSSPLQTAASIVYAETPERRPRGSAASSPAVPVFTGAAPRTTESPTNPPAYGGTGYRTRGPTQSDRRPTVPKIAGVKAAAAQAARRSAAGRPD
eukprot:TRINITY_DN28876_c0_g1_i1.p1 TRINITY_DN28876_c0_g1~~TRINITY_DN28876_c0_g1_i1.p1  ORF type:complete len:665 (+),score=155.21 TRINITY_DN28876_c0_g1_i1:85-2079(+)